MIALKTLLFDSNEISGFLEYSVKNSLIEINYRIKGDIKTDTFLKIYVLSSKKPFNKPLIADTLEFKENTASGSCVISHSTLLQNGYLESDIDTFAVAKADFSEKPISACFDGIRWDISGAFKTAELSNPKKHAIEVLNSIKDKMKTNNPDIQKLWLEKLNETVKNLKVSDISPLSDYTWYEIESMKPPIPISSYRHLLFVTEVMTEFEKYGHYLLGIKNDGHTALAVKSERFNPFINANDCAIKLDDYFVVGIYLAPDGQYFEKIEI